MNIRSARVVVAVSLLPLLAACASPARAPVRDPSEPSAAYQGAQNLPSHGVALEGFCPVSYHTAGGAVRGRPEYAASYRGATYWCASFGAKERFVRDPERYVPRFGGWCAYGMSRGQKMPVDPYTFEIVDGRLLLFLKNADVDARSLWRRGDALELLACADAHWHDLHD